MGHDVRHIEKKRPLAVPLDEAVREVGDPTGEESLVGIRLDDLLSLIPR